MVPIWHIPLAKRGPSGHKVQNFLWQDGPVYIMDNHRAAWWCWLRHLQDDKKIDVFHIDRHTDTLGSNMAAWLQMLPLQMRGVSLQDYLNFETTLNGFSGITIRWDNYLSLFLAHERLNLGYLYFATHHDGDKPDLLEGSWYDVEPWKLPQNFDFWLQQSCNWIVNIDLDYFFCDAESGGCTRFLSKEYVRVLCMAIKKNLESGRIKVLTLCLTPDEGGFSGGWAAAEALCAEFCTHLDLKFRLPP